MKYLLVTLLLLFGCSDTKDNEYRSMDYFMSENGKLKVLSTTGIISDLVKQIGENYIDHETLIAEELDPHSYELVKGDDEKISFAGLIFYNGLGLEHGASLHYSLSHHPRAVALGEHLRRKYPEKLIKVDGVVDPHVWMDISFWRETITPIVETLSQYDAEHAQEFKKNGEKLRLRMEAMDEKIFALLQQVPSDKRYLVTSHDAFNYFTRRYLTQSNEDWRPRFAAPEGLSPEGQLSAAHISQIIDHLALYQIGVVFPESNVSRDSLKKIVLASREKGISVKIASDVLYGDALGGKNSGAESYLNMMEHNASVLEKEWQ